MPTSAVIARPIGDVGWEGKYHFADGYPTFLGRQLWRLYHRHFGGDVDRLITYVLAPPVGWSYLGIGDSGEAVGAYDDKGEEWWRCIGGAPEDPMDPTVVAWVYVVTPHGIDILRAVPTGEKLGYMAYPYDGSHWVDVDAKEWRHVATVPWDGPEPEWRLVGKAKGD